MDPHEQFCHNPACWASGASGLGNMVIHSRREQRYKCVRCGKTCSATKGTALYRAHKAPAAVEQVVTLLAHGCPPQAIVAAFGWDERTVARYQREAGAQCRRLHERLVQAGQVALAHVQADGLRVRVVGGVVWLAMALTVTSRPWLGGVVRVQRDGTLIRRLLERGRACGAYHALLLCTDGLRSYATQARRVFRDPQRTGQAGRPRWALPAGLMLAQAVKQYAHRRVVGMGRRVALGSAQAVQARLDATQAMAGAVINTAYIERLNATFRARLAVLVRRSRAVARQTATLEAGMWLVGCCYNFCWTHRSLRRWRTPADPPGQHWFEQTPAMAAGLTAQPWPLLQLLTYRVPPPPVKRRGRRPRWLQEATHA